MKKTMTSSLALAVAACLSVPAFASAPSTASEAKKPQFEQLAKKGKGAKTHKAPKKGAA